MHRQRKLIITGAYITLGSAIYALATHLFIFSQALFLGGTSGVSVILAHFFPRFSSGNFLAATNVALMILALIILGRSIAVKTMVGSALTTLFIALAEYLLPLKTPLISSPVLSALAGAAAIAAGSALLFYVDSSSGGTDILALIVKKFSGIRIGRALLVTDILIVVIGACVSPLPVAIGSAMGLLIKTLGIDFITAAIHKAKNAAYAA